MLRPQDCLIDRIRVSPAVRRKNFAGNGNPNPKAPVGRRNRRRSASLDDLRNNRAAGKGPTAGHVNILRRGQSLDQIGGLKPVYLSPSGADVYAGSAVAMSPSPRALPLPSFFGKKPVSRVSDGDSATIGLRRLLRLE